MIALARLSRVQGSEIFPVHVNEQQSVDDTLKGPTLLAWGQEAKAHLYVVCPAENITPEEVNFLAVNGRGLVCLAITAEQALRLRVPPMVAYPTNPRCASFGRSIEAKADVSTGISAADRARTMRLAANPDARPAELVSPGHVFPIIVHHGDTSVAASALNIFSRHGKQAAIALCQVLRDDGNVATLADLQYLAWAHNMPVHVCSIE